MYTAVYTYDKPFLVLHPIIITMWLSLSPQPVSAGTDTWDRPQSAAEGIAFGDRPITADLLKNLRNVPAGDPVSRNSRTEMELSYLLGGLEHFFPYIEKDHPN